MSSKEENYENLKQTINALLIPYKNGCTIKQLTNDYYETQGEHVPFQEFGTGSVLNLLRGMHDTVSVEFNSGQHIVRCKATEKTAHIHALVAGQKAIPKKGRVVRKHFRPTQFYPNVPTQTLYLPAEILSAIIELVDRHPRGINKIEIMELIQRKMPNIYFDIHHLDEQLRKISHRVYSQGYNVYPTTPQTQPPVVSLPPAQSQPISSNNYVGGCDELEEFYHYNDDDDEYFLNLPIHAKETSSLPRITTSHSILDSLSNYPCLVADETTRNTSQEKKDYVPEYNDCLDNKYADTDPYMLNNIDDGDLNYLKDQTAETLINDKLRIRLENLIEKYPAGIWCAELPDKYLEEYRVPLSYTELGYNSVREFASQLSSIFRCVSFNEVADYKLYSVKSETPSRTNDKPTVPSLLDLHAAQQNGWENESDVLPSLATTSTCRALIPENVLTIGECVGLISVESLASMDYVYHEVVVVEVFTPSFFWIQLRKHKKRFKKFMSDLHCFYDDEGDNYIMPSVVMEQGLNCVCMYGGVWHRGIIKSVNPDLQVTVFFYDYGTLKTYPASHLRYMHRKFSHLPAQAVACALVNIRPYTGTKWTRSVTHVFSSRTSNIPLVATVSAINEEDNSMMITLTDTSKAEDVHINDWMVERKFAKHGQMVCMKRRNFLFAYYLQCRENLRRLIDKYCERKSGVKCNTRGEHKHIVATSVSSGEKICENSNAKQINTTKTDSRNALSDVSSKSGIHRSGIGLPATSSSNIAANKNAYTKDSSGNLTNSNSSFPNKPSTRYKKLLSLLELTSKSNSSKSTTLPKENRPSDIKRPENINDRLIKESHGGEFDSPALKSSSNDNRPTRRFSLFQPNLKTNLDDDEIQDIACPGTCGGTCSKGHQIEPVDWSKLLQNSEERTKSVAAPTAAECKKDKEKSIDFKEQLMSTTVADNSFVEAAPTIPPITSAGGNIYWTTSGNISNNEVDRSAVLKKTRNVINNFKGNHFVVSQELLDKLSMQLNTKESKTSEFVTTNDTEKQTDGSEESSSREINSLLGESDIPHKKLSNSQSIVSGNLSECNDDASKCAANVKLNGNENSLTEEETEESCDNETSDSRLSSNSISSERLDLLPAIFSEKVIVSDTNTSESQKDSKDLSNESEKVQQANQNLNDSHTTTDTNDYIHLEAHKAKLTIWQMLMKMHGQPKPCDYLDSDDCLESDEGEVASEPIQQLEEMGQENSCEISECEIQEISLNSQVDAGGDLNQTETFPEEKFHTEIDYVIEKESEKLEAEVLDEPKVTNTVYSTPVTTEINPAVSVDVPVFNDFDVESDTEEFDIHVQLADMFRSENVAKDLPCIEV